MLSRPGSDTATTSWCRGGPYRRIVVRRSLAVCSALLLCSGTARAGLAQGQPGPPKGPLMMGGGPLWAGPAANAAEFRGRTDEYQHAVAGSDAAQQCFPHADQRSRRVSEHHSRSSTGAGRADPKGGCPARAAPDHSQRRLHFQRWHGRQPRRPSATGLVDGVEPAASINLCYPTVFFCLSRSAGNPTTRRCAHCSWGFRWCCDTAAAGIRGAPLTGRPRSRDRTAPARRPRRGSGSGN